MFRSISPHLLAVLQALFVTFLWSTSWIFIKFGLHHDIPALTFAGLRYTVAFACLLLILLRRPALWVSLKTRSRRQWLLLVILGLAYYAVNQGAQFLGLAVLPAATVNLLLSLTALVVTLLGIYLLGERPTKFQWLGVSLYGVGVLVYFYPVALPDDQSLGVLVVLVGVAANAVATLLGRSLNRQGDLHALALTTVTMGIGSLVLLGTGIAAQGIPPLSVGNWLIVGWLALVNTAFAFTLWNHTLRTLSAIESSVINNAMLVQIPILAWLFLGETIGGKAVFGLLLAGLGILAVQLRGTSWLKLLCRATDPSGT
jgi:drug/metabolite transporter (DMT)-like permease